MSDEPKSHRIELNCPECGHLQREPALVISTQCRACRATYQVRDGKVVSRARPATRLVRTRLLSPPSAPPPASPANNASLPLLQRFGASAPATRLPLLRWFHRPKTPKEIVCFDCHHQFTAVYDAQSSQCPRCGSYISLRNFEIAEHWNRKIKTRGNVIIQKTGTVSGGSIQCHHLTVLGELSGSVECSGDLIIRSHGKILGKVRCRQLRVERGAHVEFLNPVETGSAYIDGEVRGQIFCSGTIVLEKRTHLQGLVRAGALRVKPGAKHSGTIEIIQAEA